MVASTTSIQEKDTNNQPMTPTPLARARRDQAQGRDNGANTTQSTDSLTSSWTMPGPELIMPSIYEAPVSEASWVAPVRSKDQTSSETMRKRRKNTAKDTTHGNHASASPKPTVPHRPTEGSTWRLMTLIHDQSIYVQAGINILLLIMILHLLVVPEFIYQAPSFCNLPIIKTIYPTSCIRPIQRPFYPPHFNAIITPEETLTQAQNHLESIFTRTLDILTPHSLTLKDTESMLSNLHSQLTSAIPNAHNALGLELQGSDTALRAASWEFDSLRADLRSAMDSLLASPISQETGPPSITRDTRLAVQSRRRAEYLDRLRAQLRSKADSLIARFATLDDHLEAVEGIISREQPSNLLSWGDFSRDEGTLLQSILHSLSKFAPFFGEDVTSSEGPGNDQENASSRPVSTGTLLRSTARHYHPIAGAVSQLSQELAEIPRARAGSPW